MTEDEIQTIARPDEVKLQTPYGTICIVINDSTNMMVVSGKDVGWFRYDGALYYAAATFKRIKGAWAIDEVSRTVRHVAGEGADARAGEEAAPDIQRVIWEIQNEYLQEWVLNNPGAFLQNRLFESKFEFNSAVERVASLERQLKRERQRVEDLRTAMLEVAADYEQHCALNREGQARMR